ncbi:uncharacterized protein [Rutidosis leptorrhynchoides]|uniref:uncharacterized protein n=1 Tax=Rutidosis leptorrhynchoides TaxID=125765 RepID=UPI003A999EC8
MTKYNQLKSEDEISYETPWSEEHERLPLKQRLKMLHAKALFQNPKQIIISDIYPNGDDDDAVVVKKEDDSCDSIVFQSNRDQDDSEGRYNNVSCKQNQHVRVPINENCTLQDKIRPEIESKTAEDDSVTQLQNCKHLLSAETADYSDNLFDDLDHVVLKERQRMLLSRRELAGFSRPVKQHNPSDPSSNSVDTNLRSAETRYRKKDNCGRRSAIGKSDVYEKCDGEIISTESQNYNNVHGAKPCSSVKSATTENNLLSSSCKTDHTSALQRFPNVKVEPLDDDMEIQNKDAIDTQCKLSVKSEHVNNTEIFEDIIDHMLLGDRMRLLATRTTSKTIKYESLENSKPYLSSSASEHKRTLFESSKPLLMKQPRKRRKTVTDSIETALEEDAPGLLQVLMEKGVLVDEIKLYGETEGDDVLDESLIEDSFSELEDVIAKIFSQRQSLLKLAPIRCGRGEKVGYCLTCLISLVEQARYLRIRKWPVEWGWCRDLQSFIFVFKKHNRIVLERPEYGYATYFFELVDALPVNWQIKRLVTAMKLTSCSRMTLIENRALMVGDDLTEGEARVLMEYGWIPDSGIGTMLNYCDRVVHDRKNDYETDSSEWRSKIGKLLTDGYNSGIIVPNDIPKKVMEYGASQNTQIKLEQ